MTPETLQKISAALYGPRWQALDLANDLDVSDRNVRRWIAGSAPVPPGVVCEVYALCQKRGDEIARLLWEIYPEVQAAPPPGAPSGSDG